MVQNTVSTQEKTETVTNITIPKITENLESNTILEVTDDKVVLNLLINIKFIVIVVDSVFPILNTHYSTRFIFCETNVRYLYQENSALCISIYFLQLFGVHNPTTKYV